MRTGRVEQIASPRDIYERPATPFVASFVGTTNLLDGVIRVREGESAEVAVAGTTLRLNGVRGGAGDKVVLSLRPEALRLLSPGEAAAARCGTLTRTLRAGGEL